VHHWQDDNPRRISNLVCREDAQIPDPEGRTHWMWAWGQFLDHGLDLTLESEETIAIEIDPADPHVEGEQIAINFKRSAPAPGTGFRYDQPRENTNVLSAYIDASSVYGVDTARLAELIGDGSPFLATGPNDLLPTRTADVANAEPANFGGPFFLAGDVRVNEHVVLTSLHTTFVRLHNHRVQMLIDAGETDAAAIFTRARAWVAAVMQFITYCEFLPELLGVQAVTGEWHYGGYRDYVETSIATEFSTAAYRLGHSMLPASLPITQDVTFSDSEVPASERLDLKDAFFKPDLVAKYGMSTFIDLLHTEEMQQIDTRVSEGLRNFLFRFPNGAGGVDLGLLDLASLNIMRGRDHRLANYNDVREGLGLPRATSFAQIGRDPVLVGRLQQAYGDVDSVDLWVGGLAETPLPDAAVGETFYTILLDQFMRLRDGDRYYWENDDHPLLDADERDEISSGYWTLARVLTVTEAVSKEMATNLDPRSNVFNTCGMHRVPHLSSTDGTDVSAEMPGYGSNAR